MSIANFTAYFLACFSLSCFAIAWANKITSPGNFLYFLRSVSRETLAKIIFKIRPQYQEKNYQFVDYWMKPFFECEECIAGQLSFWYYVYAFKGFGIFEVMFFVGVTIFFTNILKTKWN